MTSPEVAQNVAAQPASEVPPPITVGRIALYRLTSTDAERINRRRTDASSIDPQAWPAGAQAHVGNPAREGQEFPMLVVSSGPASCNGQVYLDGNDVLWATSVQKGQGPGTWSWPQRV